MHVCCLKLLLSLLQIICNNFCIVLIFRMAPCIWYLGVVYGVHVSIYFILMKGQFRPQSLYKILSLAISFRPFFYRCYRQSFIYRLSCCQIYVCFSTIDDSWKQRRSFAMQFSLYSVGQLTDFHYDNVASLSSWFPVLQYYILSWSSVKFEHFNHNVL